MLKVQGIRGVHSYPGHSSTGRNETTNNTKGESSSNPLRIAIITDAWHPQTNGVVRTLNKVGDELSKMGHGVEFVTPNRFPTVSAPNYPEVKLAYNTDKLAAMINRVDPNAIHIATEGPLGLAGRSYAKQRGVPFTTSYHTQFPEYLQDYFHIPTWLTYGYLRWFHKMASSVMVPTESIKNELEKRGFRNLKLWTRGVDTDLFKPMPYAEKLKFLPYPRPIFLNVGRVSVEKNINAFLDLDLPGTKVIVGDGPQLNEFRNRYPEVVFTGAKRGEELSKYYGASDVFVFPSCTDTFGLVLVEALASGIPVAAFPIPSPIDVVGKSKAGFLDNDLRMAALAAYSAVESRIISASDCRDYVMNNYTWPNTARLFFNYLKPFVSMSERKNPHKMQETNF